MKKKAVSLNNILVRVAMFIVILLFLAIFLGVIWHDLGELCSRQEDGSGLISSVSSNFNVPREINTGEIFFIPQSQSGLNDLSFTVSPDGSSFVYIVKEGGQERVVLNGQAEPLYDAITFLMFSSDSQRFAYGAKSNGKEFVVLDGQAGVRYDWIFKPYFFTPQGEFFVYKARKSEGDVVVINEQESAANDYIYAPFVTNDNNKLVYYSRQDQVLWRTVIDLE